MSLGGKFSFVISADIRQEAATAHRFACFAHIAAVQYEPVVRTCYKFLWDVGGKSFLCAVRISASCGEAHALGDAEHMCVDCHCRFVVYDREYYIGCLATHSGQTHKVVNVVGDLASEIIDKLACHAHERTCFVVRIRARFYQLENLFARAVSKGFGSWKGLEKRGCYNVDTFVGALSR